MASNAVVTETALPDIPLFRRGKVRDVYDLGDKLLVVATDRISAFDYVLGSSIPDKGKVLTQLSAYWFEQFADIVPHHLISTEPADFPAEVRRYADLLRGRSMLVHRTRALPVECVARGYLAGSGWKDYQSQGTVCGVSLPPGLLEADRLPEPIFTPATKADTGHDENIPEEAAARILGHDLVGRLRQITLELYGRGAAHAEARGIIVADTKLEFGLRDRDGREELTLIDEVLTPDSSRFWPREHYKPGGSPPSFDKQYVRDYLESIRWNKQPPVPALPDEVVRKTREKYLEAFRLLAGRDLV